MEKISSNISNERTYSIEELFYVIKKHLLLIIICICSFIILGIIYNIYYKPIYRSEATIIISEDSKSSSFLEYGFSKDVNFIDNEIEILKSRSTSIEVIKKLLTSQDYEPLYLFNELCVLMKCILSPEKNCC